MLCRKAGLRVLRGLGVGLPWPRAPEVENLETGCDSRRVGDQSRGGGEAIRRGTQRHGGIGKEITSGVGAGRCDSDQSEVPNGIFLRRNSDEGVPLVIGQRRRSFEMNGHQDSPSIRQSTSREVTVCGTLVFLFPTSLLTRSIVRPPVSMT